MDRRRFLLSGARVLGAGMLYPWGKAFAGTEMIEGMVAAGWPDIAVAKGDPVHATHLALEAIGGMSRFVQPGQVVAVKPNSSFACPPDWGATTHPGVLTAVIEACLEAGARRILVVDHTMKDAESCFQRNGTTDAVAPFPKAKLVSLDRERSYTPVEVPAGKALHTTEIPVVIQKADVFINVPTAKSHAATRASMGLKNLMGLVWDRHRFHSDMDLHMGIADLATVLRPDLTILDAVRILKTGGPSGPGEVDPFNGVIVGVDPVAVDAYGIGLSTWNGQTLRPDQIGYLRHAAAHGLGVLDVGSLKIAELS